ncbi:MAG: hypothetical protein ACE5HT_06640 [Gemmatimonadales bacterium]
MKTGKTRGLVCLLAIVAATPAAAQYPDTYVLPRGVLRASFEPLLWNYDERFRDDGEREPLGTNLTFDSAGVNFYAALLDPRRAIRSITGDSTYKINAGKFRTVLDADVRRFPFNFQLGVSNRLTLTLSIPIVTTRIQAGFTVDSSNANVGWNQVAPTSGDANALSQISTLLSELDASAAALDGLITGGGLDCPSGGPQCAAAQNLLGRTRTLKTNLTTMTGVNSDGTVSSELPPFAPLDSSIAGRALTSAIQGISAELQGVGVSGLTGTLPLPSARLSADDVQAVLTTPAFGYNAFPIEFAKTTQRLGDLEVGARWGLVSRPSLRAVVSGIVRLPTGLRDSPSHFLDIGTGDKQTDIELGMEAAFEPGSVVGLALAASYNLQLSDNLTRRITPINQPIALASTEQIVSRNLGDEFRFRAFPTLRLNPAFRAFAVVDYYRKSKDTFSLGGGSGFDASVLDSPSMRRVSVGAGIHYRSIGRAKDKLPIEAGLRYLAAFNGSGGFTPKTAGMNLYLRLFYHVFGGKKE